MAARAQQAMPVVGILDGGGPQPDPDTVAAFRKGLSETGFVEGRNVAFELRATEQYERLPALAGELVRRPVNVIFAASTPNSAQAAKAATLTIPIVFQNGNDPV